MKTVSRTALAAPRSSRQASKSRGRGARIAAFLAAGVLAAPAWVGATGGDSIERCSIEVGSCLSDANVDPELGRTWIVRSQDNICGLKVANQLSNPAQVDYSALLDATPQMKEMKRRGIRASSPEGIALKNAAVDAIATAADSVRSDAGHCSVWKSIRHKDGDAVPDITEDVAALLGEGE